MQNFTFMGATVFEIAGGSARPPPPLVKGVGTKMLGKGRVKGGEHVTVKNLIISCYCMLEHNNIVVYVCICHYGFDMLSHLTS